jgi:hypothetical protein
VREPDEGIEDMPGAVPADWPKFTQRAIDSPDRQAHHSPVAGRKQITIWVKQAGSDAVAVSPFADIDLQGNVRLDRVDWLDRFRRKLRPQG